MLAAGCPVVGREMLATGFPNDWEQINSNRQEQKSTDVRVRADLIQLRDKYWLCGFSGVSGSVFEESLNQFFANASVITWVIVSKVANKKMVITKDVFSEMFHLPTEGIISFSGLPTQPVADMKTLFSTTNVPFKPSIKNRDMKVEYRLLNDIVAKLLTAKAGSFDVVTTERFDMMNLVKADLGEYVALHPIKVLNTKSVHTYLKKNQAAPKSGEEIKASRDKDDEVALPKKKKLMKSTVYCMGKLEDDFMLWAETEKVSELLQRRLLVQYRLYEEKLREMMLKPHILLRNRLQNMSNQLQYQGNWTLEKSTRLKLTIFRPVQQILSIYSSDSNNNEEHQVPDSSGLAIVQYTEQKADMEAAPDLSQAGQQPINISTSTPATFDIVSEFTSMKRVVESLESSITKIRDEQTYLKYDSHFRQVFYRKMDEVVATVNNTLSALEINLVRQINESHQYFATEMTSVRSQLAEMVNCLKELSDAKKGEGGNSKKRRLL
ncbi:hypothetical protein F511_22655 [Dorcoceras hygrometricum]|uniref:Uncharacterized protein n=1 Tax=Dorcoceras hygrometricum TaxID=472368 RepID=A0A2Z7BLQ3_9LAMI|nr:hypothetical protein F511_22655 [Dorcoceras hygrometricum]